MEKFRISDPRYNDVGYLTMDNPLSGPTLIGGNHFITARAFDNRVDNILYLFCNGRSLSDTSDWPPIARSNRT